MNRKIVTLLTTLTFIVLSISGILAFLRPFSIQMVGLHSLMGFAFVSLVLFHVANSFSHMKRHLRGRALWISLIIVAILTVTLWWQPAPVKSLLRLSGNLGPAKEKFEISTDEMVFQYIPAESYKMKLTVKTGRSFEVENPPYVAIWLENQGAFHIKTLLSPSETSLPYWSFKREGWQKARKQAGEKADVDAISAPTPNGSFDPADYILPADPDNPMPYQLLIEIDQPGDGQSSLIYSVEIDNSSPKTFQLLDLVGYPKQEETRDRKVAWSLYYVDQGFSSALKLIDSALLTIERSEL